MTRRQPDRMLALDFSGTLSLEAALFARDENLVRALQDSGLWQVGVSSLEAFWDGIVNPTWQEGSTTAIGYTALLVRRLRELTARRGAEPGDGDLETAAARFVEAYLRHSPIDPAWEQVLHQLLRHPGLLVVVATDHYAEATGHILSQLSSLGLAGAPVLQAGVERVLVANSADVGYPKASKSFWAAVQGARRLDLEQVVLIDDFGFHEQPLDSYACRQAVVRRREETVQALSSVFAAPMGVFPFLLSTGELSAPASGEGVLSREGKEELLRQYRRLVRQAGRFAASALALE